MTTVVSPWVSATVTGLSSTVLSGFTEYTYVPCGPRRMAAVGTTVLFLRVSTRRSVFTNWFGQSLLSLIAENRLELRGAGRGIDLVVDSQQFAASPAWSDHPG